MPREIAISIINFRTGDLTLTCVQSVLADIDALDAEIIVVDNASGDGSAEQIAAWIEAQPQPVPIRLIRAETNSGFSGGHNLGIAHSDCAYVLILNSDAILRPRFFHAILQAARATPAAGLIAPRVEGEDGAVQTSHFPFASPLSELVRAAATGPVTKLLQHRVVALPPGTPDSRIDWVSFACVLLKREMIREIGPMDEGYFLYFEDSEYCLRAKRAGWKIATAAEAVAVHYRGGSGPVKALEQARKRLPSYFYHSRSRFLRHAHGHAGLILANLLWHVGRGIAHLRRLFRKPVHAAIEREARDIWQGAWTPLAPRHTSGECSAP